MEMQIDQVKQVKEEQEGKQKYHNKGKKEKSWQAEFPTDHCQIIYILCHCDISLLKEKEEFKLFSHM